MKRDRFLTLIESALEDPSSPISHHWKEIVQETFYTFRILNLLRPKEVADKLRKIAKMRFMEGKTDEEIAEAIPGINKDEVYKMIKVLEQNVSDIMLSIIADYLPEFRDVQVNIFVNMAHQEAADRINLLNETEEDAKIQEIMKVLERYHKKYHLNSSNMGRKHKPKNNITIFDFTNWQN